MIGTSVTSLRIIEVLSCGDVLADPGTGDRDGDNVVARRTGWAAS